MLRPFASSAEACPWNCIKCTAWDPNAWPKTCLTYECVDAGGNCGEDNGGGGGPSYQPPTISHMLNCFNTGNNGWCIGALSLDLTASDPQGQSVIISGDVNGTAFACPSGQTTCSIPLPEGTGTATYKVDSATGLSASGSTTYQLDVTTPQISGSINGSSGQNGWHVTQTVVSASAFDSLSGLALLEVSMDGSPYNNYQSPIVLMDGIHTIQFRAYDNAGNLTETPVQPVLVDTLPPTLNVPGSVRLVDALNYQLADATSGLSQLTVSIADKDHLQPDVLSNFAVTGNAQDGSLESIRIETPYLSFMSPRGILSLGRKTEVSTGIKMPNSQNETISTEISSDGYSVSTSTNPSINFGLQADNVSLGFKLKSPVEVSENNYSGSIGYSVMANLYWSGNNVLNKIWDSTVTLDINHLDVDLSTGEDGYAKGNVSDGAYVSFKPVKIALIPALVTVVLVTPVDELISLAASVPLAVQKIFEKLIPVFLQGFNP